uniref:Uncharacterized protein n=1 Tax=Branchiostoma floridae TaxID=7739 RepID=C3YK79_BRAFL|eukprot:XP_002603525.1 hypothetical protein BRAFLDRAFT_79060 [Branchiostoma floridae]
MPKRYNQMSARIKSIFKQYKYAMTNVVRRHRVYRALGGLLTFEEVKAVSKEAEAPKVPTAIDGTGNSYPGRGECKLMPLLAYRYILLVPAGHLDIVREAYESGDNQA